MSISNPSSAAAYQEEKKEKKIWRKRGQGERQEERVERAKDREKELRYSSYNPSIIEYAKIMYVHSKSLICSHMLPCGRAIFRLLGIIAHPKMKGRREEEKKEQINREKEYKTEKEKRKEAWREMIEMERNNRNGEK